MSSLFAIAGRPIIVAHQGGWDEILLIGGPILIIVWLLTIAKKRVDAAVDGQSADATPDQPVDEPVVGTTDDTDD